MHRIALHLFFYTSLFMSLTVNSIQSFTYGPISFAVGEHCFIS